MHRLISSCEVGVLTSSMVSKTLLIIVDVRADIKSGVLIIVIKYQSWSTFQLSLDHDTPPLLPYQSNIIGDMPAIPNRHAYGLFYVVHFFIIPQFDCRGDANFTQVFIGTVL